MLSRPSIDTHGDVDGGNSVCLLSIDIINLHVNANLSDLFHLQDFNREYMAIAKKCENFAKGEISRKISTPIFYRARVKVLMRGNGGNARD